MGEHPNVDGFIGLINNRFPPQRAAVYLSMDYLSISTGEIPPVGGESLGQRTERTLGRRGRVSGGAKNEQPYIPQLYRKYRAEVIPRAEDYLVQRARRAAACRTSTTSLITPLGQNTRPYIYQ